MDADGSCVDSFAARGLGFDRPSLLSIPRVIISIAETNEGRLAEIGLADSLVAQSCLAYILGTIGWLVVTIFEGERNGFDWCARYRCGTRNRCLCADRLT